MGLQGYNAKIKSRVPFSKKEELFFLTLCLWQANFFSRKVAKNAKKNVGTAFLAVPPLIKQDVWYFGMCQCGLQ